MKGLIYRELYLTRKTYISAFLTYLIITLLLVLINLSISFGNLKDGLLHIRRLLSHLAHRKNRLHISRLHLPRRQQ